MPPTMIVSQRVAEARFGGTAKAVGARVNVDGTARTIVGVIPDMMVFPQSSDAWTPLVVADPYRQRGSRNLEFVAELPRTASGKLLRRSAEAT